MNDSKHKPLCSGLIRFAVIARAQMESDHCVDSNTKSNSDSIDKIL